MLDIGWPELLLVAVITVLVVGPKELPRVLRTVTFWVRRAQGLAREFQTSMNELARETDLEDIKKDIKKATDETVEPLKVENVDSILDPDNSIAGMFTGKAIRAPVSDSENTSDLSDVDDKDSTADLDDTPNNSIDSQADSAHDEHGKQNEETDSENSAPKDRVGGNVADSDDKALPNVKRTSIGVEEIPIDIEPLPATNSTSQTLKESSSEPETIKQRAEA